MGRVLEVWLCNHVKMESWKCFQITYPWVVWKRRNLRMLRVGKGIVFTWTKASKKERHWLSNEPTVKDELTRAQLLKTIVGSRCKDYNDGFNIPLKKWGWEEMLWKTFALKANQKLRRGITQRMKENEKNWNSKGEGRETWNMYDNHYAKQWKNNPKGSSYAIHPKKQICMPQHLLTNTLKQKRMCMKVIPMGSPNSFSHLKGFWTKLREQNQL
jgi:hypothetical protein